MSHPLFGPEVRMMLDEKNEVGLRAFCESLHPATIAETLTDDFDVEESWQVLERTNIRDQAAIFEYFPILWQVQMLEGTGRAHIARLIEQMSHDDRVALLRRLSPRVAEELLRLVDEADRRDIKALFQHEENTVGALMTTDYAWVPQNLTCVEAIERLRHSAPNSESMYYVFILDEATRRLHGITSLRDLILSPRHTKVADLMETDLVTLRVTDDREKAAEVLARYDFLALPVADDHGRLVGIVTHDDVIDVVVQEATEDLQKQGAVGALTDNYLEVGFFEIWRKRTLWLSFLFLTGLLTFSAMEMFEGELKSLDVLIFFIPVCIATGGNSGTQAATLITRAMALGQVTVSDWWRVLRHEFMIGLAMGVTLGLLAIVRSLIVPDHMLLFVDGSGSIAKWHFGLVMAQVVLAICVLGTMIGAMLPLGFKRLGIDPALASSPFVTTFVDVTGIFVYFTVVKLYLL